ncbi:TetR/AcrR family transcriptional regulator [Paraglaciecola sp. 20A4]|uniref:TetR/AcrR family transcriptional regulator n=1 Tax=Paraglaciecola sp. 20A4 TaxID=2687288 RepID=UPI00140A4C5A|nr:TetR/AcrR family transcriptional regulator [Paraglaciecola sp. 20A4]
MKERKQGRRSAEDAQKTKLDILKVAADLFSKLGFERVSLRHISDKAGVSHSLIRHHFGSKESIWHSIIDELHDSIAEYMSVVYKNIPESYPANLKLFEFSRRMLAYMLTFKQPIQLLADAVRQEDGLVDYFMNNREDIEDFVVGLVDAHNHNFPENQIRMWDTKWMIIMYAHAPVSLTPFLTETWADETNEFEECLVRHFMLFEQAMAPKLGVDKSAYTSPHRVTDLIHTLPAPLCSLDNIG